jgi:beta-N-acetylhexosaminidase
MLVQKHGRLMIDIDGVSLSEADVNLIENPHVGGIILFERNFQSRHQIQSLCSSIRKIKEDILIAVDHEGGRVQRFHEDFTHIPSMQALGDLANKDQIEGLAFAKDIGWLLASELISAGLDISFTPVLDLDMNKSTIIGDRSFGEDPQLVIDVSEALIQGMQEAGMSAIGKHFPGHGGVAEDSHLEAPIDLREFEDLLQNDLKPYIILQDLLAGIMSAHITFPNIDQNSVSFSFFWLNTVLQQQLGFKGVIFSDDLSMKGADIAGNYADKARKALEAGCDMILVCNNRPGVEEVINYLISNNISSSGKIVSMLKTKQISWDQFKEDPRRLNTISKIKSMRSN